jgi:hypothetical protein
MQRTHSISGHWVADEDAKACAHCNAAFTLLKRRHHCRVRGTPSRATKVTILGLTFAGVWPRVLRVVLPRKDSFITFIVIQATCLREVCSGYLGSGRPKCLCVLIRLPVLR